MRRKRTRGKLSKDEKQEMGETAVRERKGEERI